MVWVAGLGLFLATLDTGIINIALPALQVAWHTTAATAAWAVAAYTIPVAGTVLLFGRVADRAGPERVFALGLLGFAAASAACGAAPSLGWLLAARAAQGFASAMLQGTAAALATAHLSPARRVAAVGVLAMFAGLGPVLGPTVGGVLLTVASWRTLFWVNLPVTLPLLIIAAQQAHATPRRHQGGSGVDTLGNLLLMAAVAAALLGLTAHSRQSVGWIAASLTAGAALAAWERRAPSPLLPRRLTASPAFWAAAGAMLAVGGATALAFMVPPYVLRAEHLLPWQVGLVNVAAPLVLVLSARPASRLLRRWPARRLMLAGLALMVAAFLAMAAMAADPSPASLAIALALYGLGAAAFFPSNLASLLAAAGPEGQGAGGSVQRLAINLGTALDAAAVGVLLSSAAAPPNALVLSLSGVRASWLFGAATLLLAAAGLAYRPAVHHRRRAREAQNP